MVTNRLVNQLQRITVDRFYMDSAVYLRVPDAPTYNDYGHITSAYEEISIDCSCTDKVSKENWLELQDVMEIDAEARFTTPSPKKGDRIKITAKWGDSSYEDETFEIVGIRNRGDFGYVVALKRMAV